MPEKKLLTEIDSKIIYSLRFILSILVVVMHCKWIGKDVAIDFNASEEQWMGLYSFSKILFGFCESGVVPLFLFFSSLLFFYSERPYLSSIKNKARCLLVPYFIWLFIGVVFRYARGINMLDYSFRNCTTFLFGFPASDGGLFHPYLGQFWYIRDLFLLCLISPLIKLCIQKLPFAYFFFACLYYVSGLPLCYEWGESLIFFGAGYFCYSRNITFEKFLKIRLFDLLVVYVFLLVVEMIYIFKLEFQPRYLDLTGCFVSGIILLHVGHSLCRSEKVFSFMKKMSAYSFWIFCVHYPFGVFVAKKVSASVCPLNPVGMFLCYLLTVIVAVSLSVFSGMALKKIFPGMFNLMTGKKLNRCR